MTKQREDPLPGNSLAVTPVQQIPQNAGLVHVVNAIADRVDPLLKIASELASNRLEAVSADARFRVSMSWIAVTLVAVIVGVAALLTYVDTIDGSTFTFILGLTVGYLLTFIRDAIQPPAE